MKPRFNLVGKVIKPFEIQKSRQGKDYLSVEIQTTWSELHNGQPAEATANYRVVFYAQKAMDFCSAIRPGDTIEVDCFLSSQEKQGNNGSSFLNYSLSGFNFTKLNRNSGPNMGQRPNSPNYPNQRPPQRPPQAQRPAAPPPAPEYPPYQEDYPNFDEVPY